MAAVCGSVFGKLIHARMSRHWVDFPWDLPGQVGKHHAQLYNDKKQSQNSREHVPGTNILRSI